MKICKTCKKSLTLTSFYKTKKSKDGYSLACSKCAYKSRREAKLKKSTDRFCQACAKPKYRADLFLVCQKCLEYSVEMRLRRSIGIGDKQVIKKGKTDG